MNHSKTLRAALVALLLSALLCAPALAKVVSPGEDFYYLDKANVLSEALEGEIYFSNKLLYDACGAQVVVVAVDTTGREAIDDYAYDLFNDWGIGDAAKNNGFLLLLAIDDDDYAAQCGGSLQPKFSAGTLKSYFDQYLEDDFAAKQYSSGVKKFFEAVFARIADTYNANVTVQQGIAAYQYVNAGGVQMTTNAYINLWTTIGASGAVYGILLAFGMIFPNERLFIIPFPFPIKAKWLVVGYIAIELFSAMSAPGDGVAHMAHLGGMLFGFLLIRYWQKHPDSSQRFGRSRGQEFFDNMKRKYDQRQQHSHMKAEHTDPRHETDEEYNARKHRNQEEIDAILDKIRKSGYDSLTKEEKQKLFEQSRES